MFTLIIVDYNALEATLQYIAHAKENLGRLGASHVVIVENGSSDGTLALLQSCYGEPVTHSVNNISVNLYYNDWQSICFCQSPGNIGYARGNNLGAEIAKQLWNDPYYIISNNDILFRKPMDLSVAESIFINHPQVGVIGPEVKTPAGIDQSPRIRQSAFHRLITSIWVGSFGAFLPKSTYQKLSAKVCDDTNHSATTGSCAWISGCFMLLNAQAFWQSGLFDGNTFLYAEEVILSRRMEQIRKEIWFCRELSIVHNHAQTTKKALSTMKMRQIDYDSNRYYYKEYEHTGIFLLTLADLSFALYKGVFTLWQKVKPTADSESAEKE